MKTYSRRMAVMMTGAAALALAAVPTAQGQEKIVRFAHHHPVGSLIDMTANKFAESVNAAKVGVNVKVFPAAQMGQEQENAEAVVYGTVDTTITGSNFFGKWVKGVGFELLPFLFKDSEHVERAMGYGAPVTLAVQKAMAEKNAAHLFGFLDLGFRDFAMRTKPIMSADDLKNAKMRAPEIWTWIRMYQLLGSRPTPITWGEVYTAMQSGVADGLDAPAANLVDNKLYEVTKYVTKAGVIDTPMAFTINKKLYDGLNAPQRAAVDQGAKTALAFGTEKSRELTANAYKILREKGIQVNELDTTPLVKMVSPMYDEYAQKNGGKEFIDLVQKLRDAKGS